MKTASAFRVTAMPKHLPVEKNERFLLIHTRRQSYLKLSSADPKALRLKPQKQEHSLTWRTGDKKNGKRQLSSSSHFPTLLKHLSDLKYPIFWVPQAGKSPFLPSRYKAIYSDISAADNVHKTVKSDFFRHWRYPSGSF